MNGIAACVVGGVLYAMTGNPVPHGKVTAWMEPRAQTVQGKLVYDASMIPQPVLTDSKGNFKVSLPQGTTVCMCIGDIAVDSYSVSPSCKYSNAVCLEVPMKPTATLDELILAHDTKVNEDNYRGR